MLNVTQRDATILYNATVKLYGNGRFIVRRYSRAFRRVKEGYEPQIKVDRVRSNKLEGEFRSDNLTRSRNLLIDLSCQNAKYFKSFITLTFNDDVQDIDIANKLFKIYITQVKRKFPSFMYLGVPEYQKGGRVHYHLMTNLDVGSEFIPRQEKKHTFNPNKNKHTWLEYYNLKYWNYGFSSAFSLDTTEENFSVTLYVLKYLYKSPDIKLFGRKKVLRSLNLEKPNIMYLSAESDEYKNVLKYISDKNYDYYSYESDKAFVPSFVQFSNIK